MPRASAALRRPEASLDDGLLADPWKTVLFNCDCHTFDEVEKIVMAATRCSLSRAREISHEVHTRGSAAIYLGAKKRCEAVADVVGSVGLRVEVAQ